SGFVETLLTTRGNDDLIAKLVKRFSQGSPDARPAAGNQNRVVCLLSLIIAGVTSLISLAERIHPLAGSIVFWTVILAAGFFSLYCLIAYAKLPAALIPPEQEFGPKHDAYLEALRVRLAANPRTRGESLMTQAEI